MLCANPRFLYNEHMKLDFRFLPSLLALFALVLVVACDATTPRIEASSPELAPAAPPIANVEPTSTVDTGTAAIETPSEPATLLSSFTPSPEVTPTPSVTPTPPPPLPLRTDLAPMTLKDWPRPDQDNGLGIHFLLTGYYDDAELDKEIARMEAMHLKWSLVIYGDENQLARAARKFKQAGIMVVWRKALRPFQRYYGWGRDVQVLNDNGMPPYMQLYNEPEVPAEWENQPMDNDKYFANLLQATKDVYNAGGYPGIQMLDEDKLRRFIDELYARQGEAIFHRMFFIPHAAGLNHPPDYVQDINGVLGFRTYATIFFKRLGFVPPFIIGEGGWKIESAEDNRFPPIDDQLHRDYTLAVFDWFHSDKLSNGAPLPDYLFAFCAWMIAGANEAGAWYDSFKGDRTLTIQTVQQIPPYVRKFSWDH